MKQVTILLSLVVFSQIFSLGQTALLTSIHQPGIRGVFLYTYDDSLMGADLFTHEVTNELYSKIFNKISAKNLRSIESSFDFLRILDDRCDIEIKCNKQECPMLKPCEENICEDCPICPTPSVWCTTTPPNRNTTTTTTEPTTTSKWTTTTEPTTTTSKPTTTTSKKTTTQPSTTTSRKPTTTTSKLTTRTQPTTTTLRRTTTPITVPNTYLPPTPTTQKTTVQTTPKTTLPNTYLPPKTTTPPSRTYLPPDPTTTTEKMTTTSDKTTTTDKKTTTSRFTTTSIFTPTSSTSTRSTTPPPSKRTRPPATYLPVAKNTTLREKWTGSWEPATFGRYTTKTFDPSHSVGTWRTRGTETVSTRETKLTTGYTKDTPRTTEGPNEGFNYDFLKGNREISLTPKPEEVPSVVKSVVIQEVVENKNSEVDYDLELPLIDLRKK